MLLQKDEDIDIYIYFHPPIYLLSAFVTYDESNLLTLKKHNASTTKWKYCKNLIIFDLSYFNTSNYKMMLTLNVGMVIIAQRHISKHAHIKYTQKVKQPHVFCCKLIQQKYPVL